MSQFLNPSFEIDASNDGSPDDWTINLERFIAGQTFTIGGVTYNSPLDPTYPTNNASRNLADDDSISGFSYTASLQSTQKTNGSKALELNSTGTSVGYGVVRGPWVYSSEFAVLAGQELTFDWQALGGNDAFDVFGFLLNTTTGSTQIVLNETGGFTKSDGSGNWGANTGGWQSSSVVVSETGNYRFVFLSGTFDETGGTVLGAKLYLDNFGGAAVFGDITYSANTFSENNANDGSISNTITLTLNSNTSFAAALGANSVFDGTQYSITNLPANLTAVVTRTGDKTATVQLTGTAAAHANAQDLSNISLSFTDVAFTGGAVASTIGGATSKTLYLDFYEPANAAPTGLGNLAIPAVLEDATDAGVAINAMTGLAFTDTNGGTLGGVVVVGNTATASQGTWQYSTNGGTNWSAVGSVSDTSGLSLSASTLLRFLPAADYNGTPPALTVRALDDSAGLYSATGATESRVVLDASYNGGDTAIAATTNIIGITAVTAVNDAPSFTKGVNQTVGENSGAYTIANWATALSAGPADESAQTLTFTVTNDNNALFAVQPSISADGTLTYTLAEGTSGTATITVMLTDDGGTTNGGVDASQQTFTITVRDAPEISNLNLDQQSGEVNTGLKLDGGDALSVTDSDSGDFNGGSLVITKVSGPSSGTFSLDGIVGKSGTDAAFIIGESITVDGVAIGTVTSDGSGTNNLTISFNASATPIRVTSFLQNLSYQSNSVGTVALEVIITDNQGANSSVSTVGLTFVDVSAGEVVEGATVTPGDVTQFGNGVSATTERKVESSGGGNGNLADGPSATLIDVQITNAPGTTVYAQFSDGLSGYIGASSTLLSNTEMIDLSRWSQLLQNDDAGRAHQSFVMDTQSTSRVLNELGTENAIRFLYAGDFEVNGGDGRPMVFSIANTAADGVTDVINISRPGTDQVVLDLEGFTGMAITGRGVDVSGSGDQNYVISDGGATIELGNDNDVIVLNDMNAIVDGGLDIDLARVFGNSFSVNVVENGGVLYVSNGLGTTIMTGVEVVVLDNGFYKKDLSTGNWEWVDQIVDQLNPLTLIGVPGTEVAL